MPKKTGKESGKIASSSKTKGSEYSAKNIQVLQGLEPVRKRPGMYIGGTSVEGLHHLVWEVADNAIDEAMAGQCNAFTVKILPENIVEVTDNGRGIPVDKHPQTKKSALETIMTTLHAGGKFGGGGYKVSGGLHGVGVSVVNALSEWVKAEVQRDGKIWTQEYKRGKPRSPVRGFGKSTLTGTKITFKPDAEIFPDTTFNFETIVDHFRKQAYLTKGLMISLADYRSKDDPMKEAIAPERYSFFFDAGIVSFVRFLNRGKEVKNEMPIYIEKQDGDITVEISLQYTDSYKEHLFAFANNIHNPEGGMHVIGFRTALTRALNAYAKKNNLFKTKDGNLTSEDVHEGLTAVISVKLPNPQFEGQTKAKLGNSEVRTSVASAVAEKLSEFLEKHPQNAKAIMEKCLLTARARLAARAAKDAILRKGVLEGMTLPGKLADCTTRDATKSELYIVEGDSAGGSAKQGRNREFQAILPLRGKLVNVEKTSLDKVVKSETLRPIIIALGVGIGESIDLLKLRYHKIIIMADADVDGAHIRTLLLTFFYRHFEELILKGHVYIAQPPLYRIAKDRVVHYVYTDKEKNVLLKKLGVDHTETVPNESATPDGAEEGEQEKKKGVNIQRYKGLGEMNPEQLWETTMNPENRMMLRVTLDDAEAADRMFTLLMGSDVEPRRHFIQAHAKNVKNLDV